MTEHDEEPVDLTPLAADLEMRAQRVSRRVMERIAADRARGGGVSGSIARFAIPAVLAAAASLAWVLATQPRAPGAPSALDRLLMEGRPVAILELMVAMEETR